MPNQAIQTNQLWTIQDVAEYLRVKPSVVMYWVRNADIPVIRIGKTLRFDPCDVKEWIESNKNRPSSRQGTLGRLS